MFPFFINSPLKRYLKKSSRFTLASDARKVSLMGMGKKPEITIFADSGGDDFQKYVARGGMK